MARLVDIVLDWLYPPRCIFCEQLLPIQGERHSCTQCRTNLPWNGLLIDPCYDNHSCTIQGFAPLCYEGMVQDALYRFKYGGHREYGKSFATLITPYAQEHLAHLPIHIIIPVPLHPKRQKQRGYNQTEQIGKHLAKNLGIPQETNALQRIKNTPPQSRLSRRARQNNIKEAFAVADPSKIKGKFILIIDDIYTTGSTIEACGQELLKHGAAGVCFLTVSRA